MKRSLFVLMALLLATPALGTVTITCSHEGSGVVSIDYVVSGEAAKVRAFALDVSVDSNATITAVSDYDTGEGNVYGIFPGTIDLTDPNDPEWNTPVAPNTDPGAEGTGIGTGRVILEMGSLYEPNLSGPSDSGNLCKFTVDASCDVTIVVETTRGGVVLENGTSVSIVSAGCTVNIATAPDCWYSTTQCHGDATDDNFVDTEDWPYFRDGFFKSYPDATYIANVCGDFTRDGTIDTVDWPEFRDNFFKTPASDCPYGGTWPPE
jgi:hypothetical protein